MLMDDLLDIVLSITKSTKDINKILLDEELDQFRTTEIVDMTDQVIKEFLDQKIEDKKDQAIIFQIFQQLKIEQSLKQIENNVEEDEQIIIADELYNIFSDIGIPEDIKIEDNTVIVKYDFNDDSMLYKKINELKKWDKDNVVDTVAEKFGVPIDNIIFIDNLSEYIKFVSEFEEIDYVSRGQKDCTYDLIPSLYRLYQDGYVSHSSEYEGSFKQKIMFYDDSPNYKSDEEVRAYGQHFGLPTNYLDFTEAHLISLLFAIEEYEYTRNHSIVFFVDARAYNKKVIKMEKKLVDFSDDSTKTTLERSYSDKSYFISVGNCNERIHFQKGCFLKVEPSDTALNDMFSNYTKIAIIDKNSKKSILKELFRLGINFENIYPDKDNMVRTIRFIKENM